MITFFYVIQQLTGLQLNPNEPQDNRFPSIGSKMSFKNFILTKINRNGVILDLTGLKGYENQGEEVTPFNEFIDDFFSELFWRRMNWEVNISEDILYSESNAIINRFAQFLYKIISRYAEIIPSVAQRYEIIKKMRAEYKTLLEDTSETTYTSDGINFLFPDAGIGNDFNSPNNKNKVTNKTITKSANNKINKYVYLMNLENQERNFWEDFLNRFNYFFDIGRA